jgi:hypothetical protein
MQNICILSLAALFSARAAAFSVDCSPRVRKSHSTWSRPVTRWARPRRSQQDGWYIEDDEDQLYDTKFVGGSREEMDLRGLPREDENGSAQTLDRVDRYSYDDDDDDDEYEDDIYEEDEDEFEEEPEEDVGNFWSNPMKGFDPVRDPKTRPSPRRRTRRDGTEDTMPTSTATPHRRENRQRSKPSKTTFRSGTPSPPKAMEDLYNRIFWYGFDPAETSSPADRTVFGGTKGKFNGLAYLEEGAGVKPSDKRSRRIRPRNREFDGRNDESDREDTDDDYYETDSSSYQDEERPSSYRDEEMRPTQYRQPVTPPYDPPRPMPRSPTSVPVSPRREKRRAPRDRGYQDDGNDGDSEDRRRAPRNRGYEDDDDDDYEDTGDWVSSKVSSWFQLDDEEEDDEEKEGSRRGRKKKRPDSSPSSPFKILDVFFGLNRDRLGEKAEIYDKQMGLRSDENWSRATKEKPRRQRRKGYAYPYVDEDEAPPVADYGVVGDEEPSPDTTSDDAAPKRGDKVEEKEPPPKRQLSWEERALAVERVPPAGIPAWGPTGDLGMDVRTKAISDALEDIIGATREVTEKESKVEQAREDVAILKVDAELERKRLNRSRQDPKAIDKLRRIDRKVDDAARALRYAQSMLQTIRDDRSELAARHWAVLSFYSPDLAETSVMDAIRELEQNEPAARRYREKAATAAASETVADLGEDDDSSSDAPAQP